MKKTIRRQKAAEKAYKDASKRAEMLQRLLENRIRAAKGYKDQALYWEQACEGARIMIRAMMGNQKMVRINRSDIDQARKCCDKMVVNSSHSDFVELWSERPAEAPEGHDATKPKKR